MKQRIEATFADVAKGRIEIRTTRYKDAHDQMGEFWVTLDKQRIHCSGTTAWFIATGTEAARLRAERDCEDYRSDEKTADYLTAGVEAEFGAEKSGIWSEWDINDDLRSYLNMSIDEIFNSSSTLIRSVGVLDKRFGKRRLKTFDYEREAEIVQLFFKTRCRLEGIAVTAE